MKRKCECDMDCFNCKFSDCVNNDRPTPEEVKMGQACTTSERRYTRLSKTDKQFYSTLLGDFI